MSAIPDHGDNRPPSRFDEIKAKVSDIRVEAGNWLDGSEIQSDAQAEAVERLRDMLLAARKEADAAKDEDKRPWLEKAEAIQSQYNTLIGKTKNVTGEIIVMEEAVKNLLTKWKNAKIAEQQAEIKRREAEVAEAARLAAEAHRAALDSTDLGAHESATAQIEAARQATKDLAAVKKIEVTGLRTVYDIEVTSPVELARAAWGLWRDDLLEWLTDKALRHVRACSGNAQIPGVKVIERKVAR